MSIEVGQLCWHGASTHRKQRAASLIAACSLKVVCFASVKSFNIGGRKSLWILFQCFLAFFVLVVGTALTLSIFSTVGFRAIRSTISSDSNDVPCTAWWANSDGLVAVKYNRLFNATGFTDAATFVTVARLATFDSIEFIVWEKNYSQFPFCLNCVHVTLISWSFTVVQVANGLSQIKTNNNSSIFFYNKKQCVVIFIMAYKSQHLVVEATTFTRKYT